ncbi:MAG: DUF2231 domain-containing protein [Marmoricola sp.]
MSSTEPMQSAKRPRSPLAGPYGHPFHPILVTVPIGAWIASVVFDIVAASASGQREQSFAEGASWLIGIGIVGALLAAAFGLLDLLAIPRGTRAFKTGVTHLVINDVVVILFVVDFFVRRAQDHDHFSTGAFVLSLVSVALLGVSGWLGGMLAYRYGVRVADEDTQREGYTTP